MSALAVLPALGKIGVDAYKVQTPLHLGAISRQTDQDYEVYTIRVQVK